MQPGPRSSENLNHLAGSRTFGWHVIHLDLDSLFTMMAAMQTMLCDRWTASVCVAAECGWNLHVDRLVGVVAAVVVVAAAVVVMVAVVVPMEEIAAQ